MNIKRNIIKVYYKKYINHIQQLINGFEPIVEDYKVIEEIHSRRYAKHFIFPFIFFVIVTLDSVTLIIGSEDKFKDIPIFNHVVMNFTSQFFRDQADSVFVLAYFLCLTHYGFLIFDKMKHHKYLLVQRRMKSPILVAPLTGEGL